MATQTDGPIPPPPGLSDCEPDEKKQGFTCVRAPQLKPTMWAATQVYEGPFTMYLMDLVTLDDFIQMLNILFVSALKARWSMKPGSRNVMVNLNPWFKPMEEHMETMRDLPRVGGFGANQGLRFLHMV